VNSRRWLDDDEFLAAVEDAVRTAEDVPREFVDAGVAVHGTSALDLELAALIHDSSVPGLASPVAATRAEPPAIRSLTFASTDLRIDVEVTRTAVRGQVVPAQPGTVDLQVIRGESRPVTVDEVGWFVIEPVPDGLCRFRCLLASGVTVVSEWVAFR
jgi:hypothetical protein